MLPSLATLANAGAGFVACGFVVARKPELAALTIFAAMLMDSLDGALARSLHATSDFGGELDSLADVISFGVAPAILAGSLLPGAGRPFVWMVISIYPLAAAWRLARFNASGSAGEEEHGPFEGLPSTAAGAAAAAATLLHLRLADTALPFGPGFLAIVMALLGILMVSRFPYRHAGAIFSKIHLPVAIAAALLFVASSVLWRYEYVFGLLMWSYVLSAPLITVGEKIRAVGHA